MQQATNSNPKATLGHNTLLDYQKFIWRTLRIAFPEETEQSKTERLKLVTEPAMVIWDRARKHKSYESNNQHNMETLEHFGDSIMGLCFSFIVLETHPHIDEGQLTFLKQKKIWKQSQAEIADSIGLDRQVLTVYNVSVDTKEDLLEAFFGALWSVGDAVLGLGRGYLLCYNAMKYLYGGFEIDLDPTKLKNEKVQLKEIIEGLRWVDKSNISINTLGIPRELPDGGWRLVYVLPGDAVGWLKRNGYRVGRGDTVIADITRKTKSQVTIDAAKQAVKVLNDRWGINLHTVKEVVNQYKPGYPAAVKDKLAKDGYVDLKLVLPNETDEHNNMFYQLLGITADGTQHIILTAKDKTNQSYVEALNKMMSLYVRSGKQSIGTILNLV